jgi:hypothetical protein
MIYTHLIHGFYATICPDLSQRFLRRKMIDTKLGLPNCGTDPGDSL